ncbi:Spy/CpxP family protein refolding chaperone [Kangiella sp. TOML190]|uniref:Spy/CpxP family protein refolding chaperone n=1 Tax=Kangiella sp. TOML190 TaxID=2931351 RepID=UPI00203C6734|nr:periplasmic heavy metal sensor [Kangiella sp. TOML190]
MNKLRKVSIAAALLASAGAMSMSAVAGPMHKHHKKMHHKEHLYKKLELTEEQKAQVAANKGQRKAQLQANKARMADLNKQIREVMQQEVLDQGRLRSLLQQEADLKADKLAQKHAAGKEFRAILTDEQRVKLDEMKAHKREKRQKMRALKKEYRNSDKTG